MWVASGDSHELSAFIIETLRLFGGTVPDTSNDPLYNTETIDAAKFAEGGTDCSDAVAKYPTFVAPFYNSNRQANVASIGCGHNDYIHGKTAAASYADILSFVSAAKTTGFTVVVGTVASSFFVSDVWRADLNTLIRDGAAANDYIVRDSGSDASLGCSGCYSNLTYFDADQTHLNLTGQVVKAGYMYDILFALGFR